MFVRETERRERQRDTERQTEKENERELCICVCMFASVYKDSCAYICMCVRIPKVVSGYLVQSLATLYTEADSLTEHGVCCFN